MVSCRGVWSLLIITMGLVVLFPCSFAASLSVGSTNYTLNVYVNDTVNYENDTVYFFANYSINNTLNTTTNCSISISSNNTNMSLVGNQYMYNRSFAQNTTVNYDVSCSIDSNTSLSENGTVPVLVNLAPIFNISINSYNITDYTTFNISLNCSDPYNDSLTITRIGSLGNITNHTYVWTPDWWFISTIPREIPFVCNDSQKTTAQSINITISTRNVSLLFSSPNTGTIINNATYNVTCNASDGFPVYRFYVETYNQSIFIVNDSKVIGTLSFFNNSNNVSISCLMGHLPSSPLFNITYPFVVDLIPPVLSNLSSATTYTTATLIWETDESATTTVFYGKNESAIIYNATNSALTTTHSITITNLTKNAFHSYYVQSCDAGGLCTASYVQSLRTNDCHYVWECSDWNSCESTGIQIRTCTCLCESACIGNNTLEQSCTYLTPSNISGVKILDADTHIQEEGISRKFFKTKQITWEIEEYPLFEQIDINLTTSIDEARIVIIEEVKKTVGFEAEHIIAKYTVLTTGIGLFFSSASLTFRIPRAYENDSLLMYAKKEGGNWTIVSYQNQTANKTL